jgi:VWFA-related protein
MRSASRLGYNRLVKKLTAIDQRQFVQEKSAMHSLLLRPTLLCGCLVTLLLAASASAQQATTADVPTTTFKTTVHRVVVDVVVADANGNSVSGLTKDDFAIQEDGAPQTVLSFDPSGFQPGMDYVPAKMPPVPANTFVNLPATPEKGPLYVLLYDLVNMDNPDQMALTVNQHSDQAYGRQQLAKFIQSKPEGSRFAIFVWSDGLHLLQGFTSDKALLYAVIDPHSNRPHVPEMFLMGENFGRGDTHATIGILDSIAGFLNGMPGRKNVIWFSGEFPLSFSPTKDDGPLYVDRIKATLNLFAQNQIAIYPVDVRGVVEPNWKSTNGLEGGGEIVSAKSTGDPAAAQPASGGQAAASKSAGAGGGHSLLAGSYMDMDEIAKETGGRAFYSRNDVSDALLAATENGASYYTLTYSPSDHNYNGRMRSIHVEVAKKGYHLEYRRAYYAVDTSKADAASPAVADSVSTAAEPQRRADDSLDVNMRHGAPTAHQLIFGAHVHPLGPPAKGTREQMAQLETADLKGHRKGAAAKPRSPIDLQTFAIDYTVMTHQLQSQGHASIHLEIAAAAYDADGNMLNATVNKAEEADAQPKPDNGSAASPASKPFRMRQEMDVPLAAASIRVAVRDENTDRLGSMEIKLPLAPENDSASASDTVRKSEPGARN